MSMGYAPGKIHKIGSYAICMSVEQIITFEEVRKGLKKDRIHKNTCKIFYLKRKKSKNNWDTSYMHKSALQLSV